jgi:hypothetical protein
MLDELQQLVLEVSAGAGLDPLVREEPVQVPRPRPVEADPPPGREQPRDQPGLEVDLEVEHDVEPAPGDLPPQVTEGAPPFLAVEDDELVHGRVVGDQPVGPGLDHPGQVHPRQRGAERVDHRQGVHDIAHRREHDNGDARRGREVGAVGEVTVTGRGGPADGSSGDRPATAPPSPAPARP